MRIRVNYDTDYLLGLEGVGFIAGRYPYEYLIAFYHRRVDNVHPKYPCALELLALVINGRIVKQESIYLRK
jgi:hypothetical protein